MEIIRFLMQIKDPAPEIVRAIEGGLAWFEMTGLSGLRETTREGSTYYESDPESKQVWWARFYDVESNKPIFGGSQDGIIYDSFEKMWQNHNRATYRFFTTKPASLIEKEQKEWRKRILR